MHFLPDRDRGRDLLVASEGVAAILLQQKPRKERSAKPSRRRFLLLLETSTATEIMLTNAISD